jgi:hypothetical protein
VKILWRTKYEDTIIKDGKVIYKYSMCILNFPTNLLSGPTWSGDYRLFPNAPSLP